jgi:hypothetical protein
VIFRIPVDRINWITSAFLIGRPQATARDLQAERGDTIAVDRPHAELRSGKSNACEGNQ